jgi:hypothetical protein
MADTPAPPDRRWLVDRENPGELFFEGSQAARLLTLEARASMEGVLTTTFTSRPGGELPVGYVEASVKPRWWHGTMWTRDAGTFLRELVAFGYLQHACLNAGCLMDLVRHNEEGFYSFPQHFEGGTPASGTELDGTSSILIAMVLLWEHLDGADPLRARLYGFLHADDSPLRYLVRRAGAGRLIAGSGEFGGGCFIKGEYCNVVQNGLARLALLAGARMEHQAGRSVDAARCRHAADKLAANMLTHLVGPDGTWIWCVAPDTLLPDPAVINHPINKGFGGINGVYCMQADVLGDDPARWGLPDAVQISRRTFDKLLATPLRREMFDRHGIWTQFDEYAKGLCTSPSYGHAYALQSMLLTDRLDLATKAVRWLAEQTYQPVEGLQLDRESPYHFYEAMFAPEAAAVMKLKQGAGALNLVNVAEPLKCARLIAGVDDSSADALRLVPRPMEGFDRVEARNWPVRTSAGLRRIDLTVCRAGEGYELSLASRDGLVLPAVEVRGPLDRGGQYQRFDVSTSVNCKA